MARTGHPVGQGTRYYRNTIIRHDLCVWCGEPGDITIDHVHPVSFGGPNHWSNYAPTCQTCNQRKGNQSVLEFFVNRQIPRSRKDERITLERHQYVIYSDEYYNVDPMWFDPFGLRRSDGEEVALRV